MLLLQRNATILATLLIAMVAKTSATTCVDACTICTCFELTDDLPGYISCANLGLTYIPCGLLSDTTYLDLSGNNFTSFSSDDVDRIQQLTLLSVLNLMHNQLTAIPVLNLPAMKILNMSSNAISAVQSGAFASMPLITSLDISSNLIEEVSNESFVGLASLTTLALINNKLSNLNHSTDPLTNLQYVILNNNSLTSVNELANSKNLVLLHLDINSLSSFPLLNSTKLTQLTLNLNFITAVTSQSLANIPKIQLLHLAYNQITSLYNSTFHNTTHLIDIDLSGNPITVLDSATFNNLTVLQRLQLSFVRLAHLPQNLFLGCKGMLKLFLDNMQLSQIPPGIFSPLVKLQTLFLDANHLSSLDSGTFSTLTSLNTLGLANNSLTNLSADIFSGLASIKFISLQGNSLTMLPVSLTTLASLTELDLSDNYISVLEPTMFSSLIFLQEFYIRSNEVSSLPSGLFASQQLLLVFDIRNNKITSIAEGVFAAVLPSITYLAMSGNPSFCQFGLDVNQVPAIYCQCALDYVARQVDSCSLLSDVLTSTLPPRIAVSQRYQFTVPPSFDSANITSDCGSIIQSIDGSLILNTDPTAAFSVADVSSCSLLIDNVTVWDMSVINVVFGVPTLPVLLDNVQLTVGQTYQIALPNRLEYLTAYSDSPHTIYVCDICDSIGVTLNPQEGVLFINATSPMDMRTLTLSLYDTFTHQSAVIGIASLVVLPLPISHEMSLTTKIALAAAIPGGFVVLVLFISWLVLLLRDRRRSNLKPHDFEERLRAVEKANIGMEGAARKPLEIKRHRIKISDIIGKGNFGKVSKGILITNDPRRKEILIAIKVSLKADSNREELLDEAAIMAQFDCPYVVRLLGVVTRGDPILILMEYCEFGSLESFLHQNLSILQLHRLAADCAEGMNYLTRNRYVHRDLAARNVLVSKGHRAKIADFGMSRESLYYKSTKFEVPIRWTAPEALTDRIFSQQSDCWSFAVLMYEIWSYASLPYSGFSMLEVQVQVPRGLRLEQPRGCPNEVYAIMKACWEPFGSRPQFGELLWRLRRLETECEAVTMPSPPYKDPIETSALGMSEEATEPQLIPDHSQRTIDGNETLPSDISQQQDDNEELKIDCLNSSCGSNHISTTTCSESTACSPLPVASSSPRGSATHIRRLQSSAQLSLRSSDSRSSVDNPSFSHYKEAIRTIQIIRESDA